MTTTELNEIVPITTIKGREWVNLTLLCRIHGYDPDDWLSLDSAQDYLAAVARVLGLPKPSLLQRSEHILGHPLLGIECGRWLNPRLGVHANQELLRAGEGSPALDPALIVLRRDSLEARLAELERNQELLRQQLLALSEAEQLAGYVTVNEWMVENAPGTFSGQVNQVQMRLAHAAVRGEVSSAARFIPDVHGRRKPRKIKTYLPADIAAMCTQLKIAHKRDSSPL